MTLGPVTVDVDASLRTVLVRMKEDGCRQLPVVNRHGRLVGIITDRDVRLAMNSPHVLHERWQDETLLDSLSAESCMTPNPITISPDSPAYRAAEMLACYKFGALPVVDGDHLVGILSVTDILDEYAAQQRQAAGSAPLA
jgi:acetoin utilization protein AcuB